MEGAKAVEKCSLRGARIIDFFLTLLLFFSCSKPTMPSPWAVKWNFWPWIAATDHRGRKAKATTRTSNRKPRRYNLITYTYTFFLFKMLSESSFLDYYTYFYFPLFVCIFFLLKKTKDDCFKSHADQGTSSTDVLFFKKTFQITVK